MLIITTARKSILKLVELQSLVAKCCKMRKIYMSLAKFANFVYFCIACGNATTFGPKYLIFSFLSLPQRKGYFSEIS